MKPYLYIAKTRVLSALAYRFNVISEIFIQCLVVVATSFFWMAAYGERQSSMGVSLDRVKNAVPYDAAKQDTGTRLSVLFAVKSYFVIVFIVEWLVLRGTAGRMFSDWVGCDDDI